MYYVYRNHFLVEDRLFLCCFFFVTNCTNMFACKSRFLAFAVFEFMHYSNELEDYETLLIN